MGALKNIIKNIVYDYAPKVGTQSRIFVAGLPKAGTHLLISCLEKCYGFKYRGVILSNAFAENERNLVDESNGGVKIGLDGPVLIKEPVVRTFLKRIPNRSVVPGHVGYTPELDCILIDLGYRGVAIIRDPRDIVVSHVHYILKEKHYLHNHYQMLGEFDKQLQTSIIGISDENLPLLTPIRERVESILEWRKSKVFYFTRFEDLIGTSDGGDDNIRKREIENIVSHIAYEGVSNNKIQFVADNMVGGTHSFRKGKIGGWQEAFSEKHKELFKEVTGDLLIKLGYENSDEW